MTAPVSGLDAVRALLDQLEQAREKATPGPWADALLMPRLIAGAAVAGGNIVRSDVIAQCDSVADAALIVAAVNAAPRLTAALRAVLDLADELETHALTEEVWGADNPERTGGEFEAGYWGAISHTATRLRAVVADALTGQPTTDEETDRG